MKATCERCGVSGILLTRGNFRLSTDGTGLCLNCREWDYNVAVAALRPISGCNLVEEDPARLFGTPGKVVARFATYEEAHRGATEYVEADWKNYLSHPCRSPGCKCGWPLHNGADRMTYLIYIAGTDQQPVRVSTNNPYRSPSNGGSKP